PTSIATRRSSVMSLSATILCPTLIRSLSLHDALPICNSCSAACPFGANSSPVCSAGSCSISCSANFADCDGDPTNGCEVNISTSTADYKDQLQPNLNIICWLQHQIIIFCVCSRECVNQ